MNGCTMKLEVISATATAAIATPEMTKIPSAPRLKAPDLNSTPAARPANAYGMKLSITEPMYLVFFKGPVRIVTKALIGSLETKQRIMKSNPDR